MPELAIMIEGQNGLNWPRWQRMARAVEDLGFAGLFRSDHFTNGTPPDLNSLELWVSFTWLASHTSRIEFGSIVSPLSFRDPVFTARMASQVNELSNQRLRLGVGAGWQEREHRLFGYDLLDLGPRFERFSEGLEVIVRLLRDPGPVHFSGKFYHLDGAMLYPRPGPLPIVIGGNGEKRTLPLAARWADEWNGTFLNASRARELNQKLDGLLAEAGRSPTAVRRTMMTTVLYGRTPNELEEKLAGRDPDALREARDNRGYIRGDHRSTGQAGRSRHPAGNAAVA